MNQSVLIGIPCLKTGGTEMQTLRLVEALTEGGYHCVTVCYFEYDYPMVQMFEKAGSRVVCLSAYGNRPTGIRNVYRFLKTGLKRVVEEYRPKIAHIQYMAPGAIPVTVLQRLGVRTIVATLHTDADIYRNLRLIHFLQRHCVTAFTCVTEAAERSFFGTSQLFNKDTKLHRHNHFTIHNCLAPDFAPVQAAGELPKAVIGIVARLVPIKGVDLVMPAFAKVLEKHPECRLLIVGDGKERTAMERQQAELGIGPEKTEWVGTAEHRKLHEYYSRMSLVWMPSRSEGFGLSAIEAMALGRAVVASATGGLGEIIDDGNDGILFRKGDADDMAAKTIALLDDIQRLQTLSANALQKAKQFSFENYKTSILTLYSKLTSETK